FITLFFSEPSAPCYFYTLSLHDALPICMLCEVGWVISGKRTLHLSGWYWKIKQRKGAKRATIALARKLLALIYTMLKTGSPYSEDRKSTRLNSSHVSISYAVFCLKKKKQ